jgi:opacity protein-like surface antigen
MSRISYLTRVVWLVAALMAFAGMAQAAMWVGGEMGPNFIANTDVKVTAPGSSTTLKNVGVDPAVLGGVTVGYDFVNAGFLGYDYPQWMSYFGFLVDFSYDRYPISNQTVTAVTNGSSSVTHFGGADGRIYPLAFVFYAHYGFLKDSDVPVGRLHPYIGVGPAIAFSSLQIKGYGTSTAANVALAVEGGIRYVLTASVTLDLALRYRYVQPDYSYNIPGGKADVSFTAHSFTPLLRVAYHF